MTPNFKSSPVQNRFDIYVMGAILILALALAAQIFNGRTINITQGDPSARELQNAPETGN